MSDGCKIASAHRCLPRQHDLGWSWSFYTAKQQMRPPQQIRIFFSKKNRFFFVDVPRDVPPVGCITEAPFLDGNALSWGWNARKPTKFLFCTLLVNTFLFLYFSGRHDSSSLLYLSLFGSEKCATLTMLLSVERWFWLYAGHHPHCFEQLRGKEDYCLREQFSWHSSIQSEEGGDLAPWFRGSA